MKAKNNSVSILVFCAWFKNVAFKLTPESPQLQGVNHTLVHTAEKNQSMTVEFTLDTTKWDALHSAPNALQQLLRSPHGFWASVRQSTLNSLQVKPPVLRPASLKQQSFISKTLLTLNEITKDKLTYWIIVKRLTQVQHKIFF